MTSPTGFLTRPVDDSNNIMLIAMPAGTLIARIMGIMMAGPHHNPSQSIIADRP
jgi:hypothetical protein